MIKKLNTEDKIDYKIFGKDVKLKVSTSRTYDENVPLNADELEELNWLLNSNIIDLFKDEIIKWCNVTYKDIGEKTIEDIYPEIDIRSIFIRKNKWHDGIAFLGECLSDPEHGISIKFEKRVFDGIGQHSDWF